jgi:hypothetical protein
VAMAMLSFASQATYTKWSLFVSNLLERSERADGGSLSYRTRHRTKLWRKGETPKIER